jgi:Flp pilus assembly protein TadG
MRGRHAQSGAAAIEVALLAPLLTVLMLGIIEAGHFTSTYQAASVCVRAGAREASLNQATAASAQAATSTCLTDAGLPSVTPTMSPANPATALSGTKVTVSFDLPYTAWFRMLFVSKTMHFSCSMMKQH